MIRSPSTTPRFVFDWMPLCWIGIAIEMNYLLFGVGVLTVASVNATVIGFQVIAAAAAAVKRAD